MKSKQPVHINTIKILPQQLIESKYIYSGAVLDKDLAVLYGVETKVLNQPVKRNLKRFPEDFMFQLE